MGGFSNKRSVTRTKPVYSFAAGERSDRVITLWDVINTETSADYISKTYAIIRPRCELFNEGGQNPQTQPFTNSWLFKDAYLMPKISCKNSLRVVKAARGIKFTNQRINRWGEVT